MENSGKTNWLPRIIIGLVVTVIFVLMVMSWSYAHIHLPWLEKMVAESEYPEAERVDYYSSALFAAGVMAYYNVPDAVSAVAVRDHYCRYIKSQQGWEPTHDKFVAVLPLLPCEVSIGDSSTWTLQYCQKGKFGLRISMRKGMLNAPSSRKGELFVDIRWKPGDSKVYCK